MWTTLKKRCPHAHSQSNNRNRIMTGRKIQKMGPYGFDRPIDSTDEADNIMIPVAKA
jgi:hypothetical protein